MKQLKSDNDSAILVRGKDNFNNFKIDVVAKNDFDDDGYERLLEEMNIIIKQYEKIV